MFGLQIFFWVLDKQEKPIPWVWNDCLSVCLSDWLSVCRSVCLYAGLSVCTKLISIIITPMLNTKINVQFSLYRSTYAELGDIDKHHTYDDIHQYSEANYSK